MSFYDMLLIYSNLSQYDIQKNLGESILVCNKLKTNLLIINGIANNQ